jgi:RNA polymerase sigma-32 factor
MTQEFAWPALPAALHERQPWGSPGIEPRLCEVLADPVIHAVMRCDGVDRAALESVVAHAQQRLRQHHGGVNTRASSTSSNGQGASKEMVDSSAARMTPEGMVPGYFRKIWEFPMLSQEEEYRFIARWREHQDPEAAHRLVTSHSRLVAKIAIGYRRYGLPVSELISEGHVGMMQALERFDPDHGVRLATYAMWWIRAAMQEYILRSWSLVKMGTTAAQKKLFFNLRKLKRQLRAFDEGDLSPEHVRKIAGELDVPEADVVSMNRRLAGPDRSLNAPLWDDGEGEWQDRLADERDCHETRLGDRQELRQRRDLLWQAMTQFNGRERNILMERRLKENPPTLLELSQKHGISSERVRQIEMRAFEKLQKAILSAAAERLEAVGTRPSSRA